MKILLILSLLWSFGACTSLKTEDKQASYVNANIDRTLASSLSSVDLMNNPRGAYDVSVTCKNADFMKSISDEFYRPYRRVYKSHKKTETGITLRYYNNVHDLPDNVEIPTDGNSVGWPNYSETIIQNSSECIVNFVGNN